MSTGRRSPILWVIAAPASVAVWSGWVGLGQKAGWNEVEPFPGIADGFTFPSALLLPIGVEAYGLYAMSTWLNSSTPTRARRFAGWSALGSLMVGALGQVCYHLLAAQGRTTAPDWVVVAVASLPVAVLGMAGLLAHLCAVAPSPEASPEVAPNNGPRSDRSHIEATWPRIAKASPQVAPKPAPQVAPALGATSPKATEQVAPSQQKGITPKQSKATDQEVRDYIRQLIHDGALPAAPSRNQLLLTIRGTPRGRSKEWCSAFSKDLAAPAALPDREVG